jgi:hypothetical protein
MAERTSSLQSAARFSTCLSDWKFNLYLVLAPPRTNPDIGPARQVVNSQVYKELRAQVRKLYRQVIA